jgi:LmbE family N-acetylglucosaminyl deacetylase
MKLLQFNKVLCLSPHPDDVEYSMLGTILKHSNTEFHLFQLAQGGDLDSTTGEKRLREVEDVWKVAGCFNMKLHFTEYTYINQLNEDGWIHLIETYMKENGPFDAIFLPNETDSHFEHRLVAGFGAALIRNSKVSLVQYYTPSTQDAWNSNYYVDINAEYRNKLQALNMFVSQRHRYYFTEDVLRAFHSDFQCSKKKLHYIEKYKIINLFN